MKEEAKDYEQTRNKEKVEIGLRKLKENQTHTQVVLGKEFKGQAFISKPEKILFKVRMAQCKSHSFLGFRSRTPYGPRHYTYERVILVQFIQTLVNQ
jgi:hypothetical protein